MVSDFNSCSVIGVCQVWSSLPDLFLKIGDSAARAV